MSRPTIRRPFVILIAAALISVTYGAGPATADASIDAGGFDYSLVAVWDGHALVKTTNSSGATAFSWFDGETWAPARLPLCGSSCTAMTFGNATDDGILPLWYKGKFARFDLTTNAAVSGSQRSIPKGATDIRASSRVAIYHLNHGEQYRFLDLVSGKSGVVNLATTRLIPGTASTGLVGVNSGGELVRQAYPPSSTGSWHTFAGPIEGSLNELRASGSKLLWHSWVVPSDPEPDADYSQFCVHDFSVSLTSCTNAMADGTVDSFAFTNSGVLADVAGQQLRWFAHSGTFAEPVQADASGFDAVRFPLQQGSGPLVGLFGAGDTLTLHQVADDGSTPELAAVRGGSAAVSPAAAKVTGTFTFGKTLSAHTETAQWYPAWLSFGYQWLRDGVPIAGATSATYRLVGADVGAAVQVRITGSRAGFAAAEQVSGARVVAALKLSATPKPKISGTAKVGRLLTAKPGTWKPKKVTLTYQWLRDGAAIAEADTAKYRLVEADRGAKISVRVTGSKVGYAPVTKTSKTTATVK